MNETVLTSIGLTGFGVAFFHAAIPTHWLPFVVSARVQRWTHAKTLAITAVAGTGHVLCTAALGLALTVFGVAVTDRIGSWFPMIAGCALLGFGCYYLYRQFTGHGHSHSHLFARHCHDHSTGHRHEHEGERTEHHGHDHVDNVLLEPTMPSHASDRIAITSLLTLLTFSPCEGFLPIYVSGIRYGWIGFALLTAILSVGTVAGMVLFTWMTIAGTRKIQLRALEKYESGVMGGLLCAIGALILFFDR